MIIYKQDDQNKYQLFIGSGRGRIDRIFSLRVSKCRVNYNFIFDLE